MFLERLKSKMEKYEIKHKRTFGVRDAITKHYADSLGEKRKDGRLERQECSSAEAAKGPCKKGQGETQAESLDTVDNHKPDH